MKGTLVVALLGFTVGLVAENARILRERAERDALIVNYYQPPSSGDLTREVERQLRSSARFL